MCFVLQSMKSALLRPGLWERLIVTFLRPRFHQATPTNSRCSCAASGSHGRPQYHLHWALPGHPYITCPRVDLSRVTMVLRRMALKSRQPPQLRSRLTTSRLHQAGSPTATTERTSFQVTFHVPILHNCCISIELRYSLGDFFGNGRIL